MKKIFLFSIVLFLSVNLLGQGSVTSDPSPLLSSKGGKIIIDVGGTNVSGTVYIYSWVTVNGQDKSPTDWWGAIDPKYQMTNEGSNKYSYVIENIQQHFGLTDDELSTVTKFGVIARDQNNQTGDLFVTVKQVPKVMYSGGEGTASSPYIISNIDDMNALSSNTDDWGAYFKLSNNITLTSNYSGIGTKANPFTGTFDGQGYSIKGLKVTGTTNATGLFPYINGATIKLLALPDAQIQGTTYVGALVGIAISGTIEECYTAGTVIGNGICVGGMVGSNESATFQNCYSTCAVNNTNDYATGGFAGKNLGTIINAYATGSVNSLEYVGGFVGANYADISNCAAINNPMVSDGQYAARFGGNNNDENNSVNNLGWKGIRINSGHQWMDYGHHAIDVSAENFNLRSTFENILGWDFNTIWKWDSENYPLLSRINEQSSTYPTDFTDPAITIIENSLAVATIVYPNPTEGELYFETNYDSKPISLRLFDITGKSVVKKDISENSTTLDVRHLNSGIYILKVYSSENRMIFIHKIIKK